MNNTPKGRFRHFFSHRELPGWADAKSIADAGLLPESGSDGIVVGGWEGRSLIDSTMAPALVMAPTRSGKTTTVLVPTLLTWRRSAVVLDFHGELFDLTAQWRAKCGEASVRRFHFDGITAPPGDIVDLIRQVRSARQPTTIYLTVAPCELGRVQPHLHAVVDAIVDEALAGQPRERENALLLALDEITALGRIDNLATRASTLSQRGIKLLGTVQNVNDLASVYGTSAHELWTQWAVRTVLRPYDSKTADFIAAEIALAVGHDRLLRPSEVRHLPPGAAVILGAAPRPIYATMRPYYEDPWFRNRVVRTELQ